MFWSADTRKKDVGLKLTKVQLEIYVWFPTYIFKTHIDIRKQPISPYLVRWLWKEKSGRRCS